MNRNKFFLFTFSKPVVAFVLGLLLFCPLAESFRLLCSFDNAIEQILVESGENDAEQKDKQEDAAKEKFEMHQAEVLKSYILFTKRGLLSHTEACFWNWVSEIPLPPPEGLG